MANPLLRRVIGEAGYAAGPGGTGRYVSGGKTYRGRYGRRGQQDEELTEMEIAERMDDLCVELSDHVTRYGDGILEELQALIEQLRYMHDPAMVDQREKDKGQQMMDLPPVYKHPAYNQPPPA